MRRVQSVFVALAVLAISAGAVFAGRSLSEGSGAATDHAAAPAGQAVPSTAHTPRKPEPSPTPTPGPTAPTVALAQPTGTDEETDATTGQHPDNHGAVVSAAAHLSYKELLEACDGPDKRNKGAYISAIARGDIEVTGGTAVTAPTAVVPTATPETTAGTTASPTIATPTITCTLPGLPPAGTLPTAAGPAAGAAATAGPTPTPAPTTTTQTKLHGKANAAAQKAAHGRPAR